MEPYPIFYPFKPLNASVLTNADISEILIFRTTSLSCMCLYKQTVLRWAPHKPIDAYDDISLRHTDILELCDAYALLSDFEPKLSLVEEVTLGTYRHVKSGGIYLVVDTDFGSFKDTANGWVRMVKYVSIETGKERYRSVDDFCCSFEPYTLP